MFPKIWPYPLLRGLTWHHPWSLRTDASGSPPGGSQSAGHLGSGPLGAAHLEADTNVWGFYEAQAPSKPETRIGTDLQVLFIGHCQPPLISNTFSGILLYSSEPFNLSTDICQLPCYNCGLSSG